ncbi:hypothetical protein [Natrinema halophilum]|uniref:Uncharacterized protein n=1 Tax=Natrinema halophilum TaxID=1699371 RepID=A0A7D5GF58_9EURY|nr:hypothetical protein [Natrinema halophilum]QLG47354.1 hypothetical protein HYG82_00105 [Natrinema halophilum]
MENTIDQIEASIASYREMKRQRLNKLNTAGGVDTDDVPPDARGLWHEMPPDPREIDDLGVTKAYETYPEESLTSIIQGAADRGEIVDLGSETYTFKEKNLPVELRSEHQVFGIVGNESDPATIRFEEIRKGHGKAIFFQSKQSKVENRVNSGYLYNVVFDISGTTAEGHTPDAGIIRLFVEDEFWAHNVVLKGKRKRYQTVDGSPTAVGGYCTWLVDITSEDGTAFHHRVKLDDGMEIHPQRAIEAVTDGAPSVKFYQGIPFGNAHNHYGTAVYKDCSVANSPGSGWYLGNKRKADEPQPDSPSMVSENILWNCEARNCAMRIGGNDKIIGGRVVYDGYWLDRAEALANSSGWSAAEWLEPPGDMHGLHTARALTLEEGKNVEVIGLEIDTSFFLRAIDVRKFLEHATLERVVMKTGWLDGLSGMDTIGAAARVSGRKSPTVEIKDCYWYDDNESRNKYDTPYTFKEGTEVIADGWEFATEHSGYDVVVYNSLTVDGTTYTPTPHYYTASDLGVADPRPLP